MAIRDGCKKSVPEEREKVVAVAAVSGQRGRGGIVLLSWFFSFIKFKLKVFCLEEEVGKVSEVVRV